MQQDEAHRGAERAVGRKSSTARYLELLKELEVKVAGLHVCQSSMQP